MWGRYKLVEIMHPWGWLGARAEAPGSALVADCAGDFDGSGRDALRRTFVAPFAT